MNEAQVLEAQIDEAKAWEELNEIVKEQHLGKWTFQGSETDDAARERHEDWVRSRINKGIELTALLRGIQAAPAKAKKGSRSAKESIAAAITEDLLS